MSEQLFIDVKGKIKELRGMYERREIIYISDFLDLVEDLTKETEREIVIRSTED